MPPLLGNTYSALGEPESSGILGGGSAGEGEGEQSSGDLHDGGFNSFGG